MPLVVAEDGALVEQTSSVSQQMDEASFRALYHNTAPMLRAYLRRACGNAALADDILQDTFCRLLRITLPTLDERQMKAYLYRTATTILTDHWRRATRERRWSLLAFLEREPHADAPTTGGDVMRLFHTLKPQEQALLWLAYVEGFDHREIAAALQLGERSVRVLLFRARKRLAAIFQKEGITAQAYP
jgi:RNA polymerase sigma-70 factor (ECF subfamily)